MQFHPFSINKKVYFLQIDAVVFVTVNSEFVLSIFEEPSSVDNAVLGPKVLSSSSSVMYTGTSVSGKNVLGLNNK